MIAGGSLVVICPRVDLFAVSICVGAGFGRAGNTECGAEVSEVVIDAGTLGDGVGGGIGSSFAFKGQGYTVMVDTGRLRVLVVMVVYPAAVEVVVYVLMMVGLEVVLGTVGALGI